MVSSGGENFNCFIGYQNEDYKIKPLRIILQKTSTYVKSYNAEPKWMNFFVKYDNLL